MSLHDHSRSGSEDGLGARNKGFNQSTEFGIEPMESKSDTKFQIRQNNKEYYI